MATLGWISPSVELPPDGEEVWVRILNYYGEPFLAKYSAGDQSFTASVSGLIFPAFYVARFKYQ